MARRTSRTGSKETAAVRCVPLQAGGPAAGPDQVVLVPGADIPMLPLDLPEGLRGSTREQIARRQLLDSAALQPETAEIRPVMLDGMGESWRRALVADRGQIAAWAAAAGPACRAVLPDYLALPTAPDIWSLRLDGDRVLARLGPQDGFSAEVDLAHVLLKQALNEADNLPRAVFWDGAVEAQIAALFEAQDVPRIEDPAAAAALDLTPPVALAHGELALDLRRDPFATRARLRRRILPWRLPVVLALFGAGLWAAAQMIVTDALTSETRRLQAQTMTLVRQHFVPTGPVLDVRTQVSRALQTAQEAARGGPEALPPLALFGQAVEALSGPDVTPQQVFFAGTDGLQILVGVPDFSAGEALVAQLRAQGLAVDVLRSEAGEERAGVQLELRLTEEGGRP